MVGKWHVARTLLGALQITVALLILSQLAHGETRPAILRGQEVAERVCSGCHAIDGSKGATVQGTDVPSFRVIAARPNQARERLETYIMVPHRPMPAIPLELSEIRDVVAYILSLR
jgi:mono/diheme cytochrome c family protein